MTVSERARIWFRQLKKELKRLSLKPVMHYAAAVSTEPFFITPV